MPIYRIKVKSTKVGGGQRIDKGLYVDVQTYYHSNPVISEKEKVAQAFLSQRGVDLKRLGALNLSCLEAIKLG